MSKEIHIQQASRLRAAAHEMLALADELEGGYRLPASSLTVTETASRSALVALGAKWIEERNSRSEVFGEDLFGEPAWDMLLYLFVRAAEQKRSLKTSVTNASGSPHSTALRYLTLLESEGLIQIERTERDNRTQLVSLTPLGLLKMSACLARSLRKDRYGINALADAIQRPLAHAERRGQKEAMR